MLSIINNINITGVSLSLPARERSVYDDAGLYGGNNEKLNRVVKSTGFERRRVTLTSETAADLCEHAARKLLHHLDIAPESIDLCLLVTQTPDHYMPATACILHDKLGLSTECPAFDVNQGCAGYTYGLWLATKLVGSSCRRALLLVGDTLSKMHDMFSVSKTVPIFGDGGSATLIEYDEHAEPIYFDIGADGSGHDAIIAKNGAFRNPPLKDMFYEDATFKHEASMDGLRIMEFTLEKVPTSIERVIVKSGMDMGEVDYFVMHQANRMIIENIATLLGQPMQKFPHQALSKFGNLSCASIPSVLCSELSDCVTAPHAVCLSGFGIGLAWASAFLPKFKPEVLIANILE